MDARSAVIAPQRDLAKTVYKYPNPDTIDPLQKLDHGMGIPTFHSLAFRDNALLPIRFTQDGDGLSPSLRWRRVPRHKPYLTIVVSVLDAPKPEVRWLLYNVLEFSGPIREGVPPTLGQVGLNSQGNAEWWAPDGQTQRTLIFHMFISDKEIPSKAPLPWSDVQAALAQQNAGGPYGFRAHYPAVPKGVSQ